MTQLEFYKRGGAGCLFAAHAATNPAKYEWRLSISEVNAAQIESIVQSAIALHGVSTQSIIFPSVVHVKSFKNLLATLQKVPSFFLEQEQEFENMICLGFRVKIDDMMSWVTGLGSFTFLPKTRQAVFTEIVFRSKPRPDYEWVMKKAPKNVLHLADMDMKGMRENKFKALWYGSLDNTEKVLGHKPDLRSAAKTTFAIPLNLWRDV
ncbi:MAG: hypothetical protein KBC62_00695 [Candidatus Pacebacteria bacterium]|jgi:hypothetical protein|nr:hypothetical protein [Candidatus Paceibacterota bacterium]